MAIVIFTNLISCRSNKFVFLPLRMGLMFPVWLERSPAFKIVILEIDDEDWFLLRLKVKSFG